MRGIRRVLPAVAAVGAVAVAISIPRTLEGPHGTLIEVAAPPSSTRTVVRAPIFPRAVPKRTATASDAWSATTTSRMPSPLKSPSAAARGERLSVSAGRPANARPGPPEAMDVSGFAAQARPGLGDPFVIREFMRQIGIPARIR